MTTLGVHRLGAQLLDDVVPILSLSAQDVAAYLRDGVDLLSDILVVIHLSIRLLYGHMPSFKNV
jgi:hypothetical protein